MSHLRSRLLAAVALVGLTACTATTLRDSWLDPSLKPGWHFQKIAVAVLAKDQTTRRIAEDTLVARITRSKAVPSYQLIRESEGNDAKLVKARLQEAGVDGIVVMRLMGMKTQTRVVPGSYPEAYYGFQGYYGMAQPMAYSAGALENDTLVQVETNVYSLADDKLVYAAHSESFNPMNAQGLVGEIAGAIADDLKKRGLMR